MKRVITLVCLVAVGFIETALGTTLGSAETFGILGASTVTNTGLTYIKGNLGVAPGSAVVGFPPGIMLVGTIHAGDAVAIQAQADVKTAYTSITALPCNTNLTGQDLGGRTLTPGVYCFDSSAQVTGPLVLDFQGNSTTSFVFQIGSTLTTASGSDIEFANCTKHCHVFWQVGSSATLGTSSKFTGSILALASITFETNARMCGRALAQTGAVTMDTNVVYFEGTLTPSVQVQLSGEGQIPVPESNSNQPESLGNGRATFAFLPDLGGTGTFLDYLNRVTGARAYGLVKHVEVMATYPDGTPKTAQFSGSCDTSVPECSFSGVVDNTDLLGAPGQFGITITGAPGESRSPRVISTGQIYFK